MEQNLVLSEQEPSYHDFNSTSTFLLRCSIDSKGTQTEFEWTDYNTAVFRFTVTLAKTFFLKRAC